MKFAKSRATPALLTLLAEPWLSVVVCVPMHDLPGPGRRAGVNICQQATRACGGSYGGTYGEILRAKGGRRGCDKNRPAKRVVRRFHKSGTVGPPYRGVEIAPRHAACSAPWCSVFRRVALPWCCTLRCPSCSEDARRYYSRPFFRCRLFVAPAQGLGRNNLMETPLVTGLTALDGPARARRGGVRLTPNAEQERSPHGRSG